MSDYFKYIIFSLVGIQFGLNIAWIYVIVNKSSINMNHKKDWSLKNGHCNYLYNDVWIT